MIEWRENTLVSKDYDDIYFSVENGLEESKYVFLQGNDLEKRFKNSDKFHILELGFGTGLNFLSILNLWKKTAQKQANLHFFSFEKSPLKIEEISQALSFFPTLKEEKDEFLEKYKLLHFGFNPIPFLKHNVFLNLVLGDIDDFLDDFDGKFDAIFLDGFSPQKNPKMWSKEVCLFLNKHSKEGTTLSSFSVARKVRDNLTQAGFSVWKSKGFGKKREMLKGNFDKKISHLEPFAYYQKIKTTIPKSIVIVGGGIAGCSLAYFLSKKNIEITLIEKENKLASDGSSHSCAISLPYITKNLTPASLYSIAAFSFCQKILEEIKFSEWKKNGVLKFCEQEEKEKILQGSKKAYLGKDWLLEADQSFIQKLTGLDRKDMALFFPAAFSTNLKKLCENLVSQSNLNLILGKKVDSIQFENHAWSFYQNKSKILDAECVIFANSYGFNEVFANSFLKLNQVRGQVTYLNPNHLSKNLKTILYFQKYFTPSWDSSHTLGSTYDEFSKDKAISIEDNLEMLKKLQETFLFELEQKDIQNSKVGFRSQTQDRTPLVGFFPEEKFYYENYKNFHFCKDKILPQAKYLPNFYVSLGLGSRGVIYSFLNALIIKSLIFNEPLPIPKSLYQNLHPARFLMRKIRRL